MAYRITLPQGFEAPDDAPLTPATNPDVSMDHQATTPSSAQPGAIPQSNGLQSSRYASEITTTQATQATGFSGVGVGSSAFAIPSSYNQSSGYSSSNTGSYRGRGGVLGGRAGHGGRRGAISAPPMSAATQPTAMGHSGGVLGGRAGHGGRRGAISTPSMSAAAQPTTMGQSARGRGKRGTGRGGQYSQVAPPQQFGQQQANPSQMSPYSQVPPPQQFGLPQRPPSSMSNQTGQPRYGTPANSNNQANPNYRGRGGRGGRRGGNSRGGGGRYNKDDDLSHMTEEQRQNYYRDIAPITQAERDAAKNRTFIRIPNEAPDGFFSPRPVFGEGMTEAEIAEVSKAQEAYDLLFGYTKKEEADDTEMEVDEKPWANPMDKSDLAEKYK